MTTGIFDRLESRRASVGVVGLGYVGMPLAQALSRHFDVAGYDPRFRAAGDSGVDDGPVIAGDMDALSAASFYIIAVGTPIDGDRRPDIGALLSATESVGGLLKRGDYVVYESTVYPGCTEDECVPLLEKISGLRCGRDFKVGYSPERINPGDPRHGLADTPK